MLEKEIEILMKKNLRNCFNYFNEDHIINVNVNVNNSKDICLGYRTTAEKVNEILGTTYFYIHLIDDICYILYIELEKNKRGVGDGWSLYESIHSFSKEFGSKIVRQTPSGQTFHGKTRKNYLLDRGYIPFGETEVELILK